MSQVLTAPEGEQKKQVAEDNSAAAVEAARLAKQQEERFAQKGDRPKPPPMEVDATPPAPKVLGTLQIVMLDNGKAQASIPPDYDLVLEMLRVVHVAMINRARQEGVQLEAEKKKVPFMKRIFANRNGGKPS